MTANNPIRGRLTRGQFIRRAGVVAGGVGLGLGGVASANAPDTGGFIIGSAGDSEITVYPSNSVAGHTDYEHIQWAVNNVAETGTVKLAPGNFVVAGTGPLTVNRSVNIVAVDPGNRPMLRFNGTPFSIRAPGKSVVLENLVVTTNRQLLVYGGDYIRLAGCEITSTGGPGATATSGLMVQPMGARYLPGEIILEGSKFTGLYCGVRIYFPDFNIEARIIVRDCEITGTGVSKHGLLLHRPMASTASTFATGDIFITGCKIKGASAGNFVGIGGNCIVVDNEFDADGYMGAGLPGLVNLGIFVIGSSPNANLMFNNNRINMTTPNPPMEVMTVPPMFPDPFMQISIPILSGNAAYDSGKYDSNEPGKSYIFPGNHNTDFSNITITSNNPVTTIVHAWKNSNCSFRNLVHNGLVLTQEAADFYDYERYAYKEFKLWNDALNIGLVRADYTLAHCNGCVLVDNSLPSPSLFDNTGTNILKGHLQKVYSMPGNPSGNVASDERMCRMSGGTWDASTMKCMCPDGFTYFPATARCETSENIQVLIPALCTSSEGTWDSEKKICTCPVGTTYNPLSKKCEPDI